MSQIIGDIAHLILCENPRKYKASTEGNEYVFGEEEGREDYKHLNRVYLEQ